MMGVSNKELGSWPLFQVSCLQHKLQQSFCIPSLGTALSHLLCPLSFRGKRSTLVRGEQPSRESGSLHAFLGDFTVASEISLWLLLLPLFPCPYLAVTLSKSREVVKTWPWCGMPTFGGVGPWLPPCPHPQVGVILERCKPTRLRYEETDSF